jgi:CRP/FNR family transcriptional regulator
MQKKFEIPDCQICNLAHESLFKELSKEKKEELSERKGCNFYKKGQIIFFEGNRPFGLFCVHEGKIKIYKTSESGKEQIFRFAQEGDILGYRALLGGEPYRATAETLTEAVICFIPKEFVFSIIEKDQDFSLKMMKFLCVELGKSEERMLNITQKPVNERLAEVLLILKEQFGLLADGQTLSISLTREDLANFVGTATETVVRHLHELRDENLIEVKGRRIKLIDIPGLIKTGKIFD